MPRPYDKTTNHFISDPVAEASFKLIGGSYFEGVAFTKDQIKRLNNLYGFQYTDTSKKAPKYIDKDDKFHVDQFLAAVDERNVMRCAKVDGLRLMAVLSKFCDEGEDPVKVLIRLLSDAGYDVVAGFDNDSSEDEIFDD